MKNEKFNKVLDVIIKVISIVSILAQTLKTAFPVEEPTLTVSQNEVEEIKEFLKNGVK